MSALGKCCIGHRAPDFDCEAVVQGRMQNVNLSTFINDKKASWLILLFIPAAFSFVCPTEVLAFQNCLEEFKERNCEILFVSVDTKHSLWHWQNVPREYGGLGQIEIPLLSDASHKISRDYGVLIEEEGVCLRGLFIIDDKAIVQQITLNNLSVGRSVIEALRLLEAFQAVAKHGVLCPIDWKPSKDATDTLNTISNTLTESYEDRLANLQREFGETSVDSLDAELAEGDDNIGPLDPNSARKSSGGSSTSASTRSSDQMPTEQARRRSAPPHREEFTNTSPLGHSKKRSDSVASAASIASHQSTKKPSVSFASGGGTARHSRGHSSISVHHGHRYPYPYPSPSISPSNSHINLEFGDPTQSPSGHYRIDSPNATPTASNNTSPALSRTQSLSFFPSVSAPSPTSNSKVPGMNASPNNRTRLQATFEAFKKMGNGLGSPKHVFAPEGGAGVKSAGPRAEGVGLGYFDVVSEGVGA